MKTIWHIKGLLILTSLLPLFAPTAVTAATLTDEHYTSKGFFDIHVCNWPNRPLFFMVLFSTTEYATLKHIDVFDNNNKKLTRLNLSKFKIIKRKGKKDKRVFIKQVNIPKNSGNGIYTATATFNKGSSVTARDHVIIQKMPIVSNITPKINAELPLVPKELKWKAIKGAKHYKIFIRDMWQDGKIIFTSKLLNKTSVTLKNINIQAGGFYQWQIHARDTNEHILLGDFNHGSLSKTYDFSIKD